MEYTITEVSEITGFSASTLRYYEKEKILPTVKRNAAGVRVYSEEDIEWISLITCLKNTNMPITDIKKFVDLSLKGDVTIKERLKIVLKHQQDIKAKIEELQNYQKHIDFKVEYYQKACATGSEDAVRHMYRELQEQEREK